MLEKLIFLFTLVLILSNCRGTQSETENNLINQSTQNMDEQKLLVNFVLSHHETSKDSNSETIKIQIGRNEVVLKKEYDGFKALENKTLSGELKAGELESIIEFIKKHQLNKNLTENQEIEGIGISGHLKIEVFQLDTTTVLIEGKTNIWGGDDYVEKNWGKEYVEKRTNIENIEYFTNAKSFVSYIENLLKNN